eukprot:g5691.t1
MSDSGVSTSAQNAGGDHALIDLGAGESLVELRCRVASVSSQWGLQSVVLAIDGAEVARTVPIDVRSKDPSRRKRGPKFEEQRRLRMATCAEKAAQRRQTKAAEAAAKMARIKKREADAAARRAARDAAKKTPKVRRAPVGALGAAGGAAQKKVLDKARARKRKRMHTPDGLNAPGAEGGCSEQHATRLFATPQPPASTPPGRGPAGLAAAAGPQHDKREPASLLGIGGLPVFSTTDADARLRSRERARSRLHLRLHPRPRPSAEAPTIGAPGGAGALQPPHKRPSPSHTAKALAAPGPVGGGGAPLDQEPASLPWWSIEDSLALGVVRSAFSSFGGAGAGAGTGAGAGAGTGAGVTSSEIIGRSMGALEAEARDRAELQASEAIAGAGSASNTSYGNDYSATSPPCGRRLSFVCDAHASEGVFTGIESLPLDDVIRDGDRTLAGQQVYAAGPSWRPSDGV